MTTLELTFYFKEQKFKHFSLIVKFCCRVLTEFISKDRNELFDKQDLLYYPIQNKVCNVCLRKNLYTSNYEYFTE